MADPLTISDQCSRITPTPVVGRAPPWAEARMVERGETTRIIMAERQSDVGTAELEVLKALWDRGPSTVRQVLAQLHAGGRQVAYTTALTFLTRLEQKGFVTSDKSELAYVYKPKVTRDRVRQSRLRSLVNQLYDGAAAPLVVQLIRTQRFSSDEIAELHDLIDRLDTKTPAKRQAKKRGR